MNDIILKIENLSKQYRLGLVGTGTISDDLKRLWYKVRGKEDPFLKVGETNDRSSKGVSEYVWALKDINFEVKRGEVLGIIGRNGAGKSTLLKILSKVTGPTTGSIKSRGRIASLLEVGTGFHPEMTGRENIFLNGAILGMSKKEIVSKLEEIVEFSGCERYIDTPVKRYSSGMKVRLAFAVAAHLEPDILVIDEVLAVGDAEFQKKAIGKMQDISQGDGRTVLFVSHNMAAVKNLCTRCIVLENGKSVFKGNTEDSISYYLNKNEIDYTQLTYDSESEYLKKIEIFGDESVFYSGKKICFSIKFNNAKIIDKDLEVNIGIYNSQEEKILHLSSSDVIGKLDMILEEGLNCKIHKNPLIEGNYYANIVINYNKNIMEKYNNAIRFQVINGDFYETQRLPKIKNIKVLVEQEWIICDKFNSEF